MEGSRYCRDHRLPSTCPGRIRSHTLRAVGVAIHEARWVFLPFPRKASTEPKPPSSGGSVL